MSGTQHNRSYRNQQHTARIQHNTGILPISGITEREKERFWIKVDRRGPEECWPWLSATNTSRTGGVYGQFFLHGKPVRSHRVAYILGIGPIPDGLTIDHVRTRCQLGSLCHNPAHLEAVTNRENLGRYHRLRTHCRNGHERTPGVTCSICRERSEWARNLRHRATKPAECKALHPKTPLSTACPTCQFLMERFRETQDRRRQTA